jgi:excisionase family DNA binding protein
VELARLYTMAEVMEAFSLSRQAVKSLIDSGALAAIKVGQQYRFTPEAVEALIDSHAVPVRPARTLQVAS